MDHNSAQVWLEERTVKWDDGWTERRGTQTDWQPEREEEGWLRRWPETVEGDIQERRGVAVITEHMSNKDAAGPFSLVMFIFGFWFLNGPIKKKQNKKNKEEQPA